MSNPSVNPEITGLHGRQALLNSLRGTYAGATDRTLQNAVYVRIVTPLGKYWADPALGSRLHELQREKDLPNRAQRAKDYIESALKGLLDEGRADRIEVLTDQRGDGVLRTYTEVFQSGQQVAALEYFVEVE